MGLLKNDDRRFAPGGARKPYQPVRPPHRAVGGRSVKRAGGLASAPTYVPDDDDGPAGDGVSGAQEAAIGLAQPGGAIRQSESVAFALHLSAPAQPRDEEAGRVVAMGQGQHEIVEGEVAVGGEE